MIILYVLVPALCLLLGVGLGYLAGRREAQLLYKLRTLTEQGSEVVERPPQPGIVMGEYEPPAPISSEPEKRKRAGIAITKTPELLEWEEQVKLEEMARSK